MNKFLRSVCFFILVVGCTPVKRDGSQSIYKALEDQNLSELMQTLNTYPDTVNLTRFHDSEGNNILHLIVRNNAIDDLLALSKTRELPYNRYNNQYETPLSVAVDAGHCQIFELLLIKGADPLLIVEGHPTILSQTVIESRYPCMETLLINSDALNQKGQGNWEALHYAAYLNNLKAARLLAHYHPHFFDTVPIDTEVPFISNKILPGVGELNPFQIAVFKGYLTMAKFLLSVEPTYLSSLTTNGTTNSDLAKISKSPNMIVWLASQIKNPPVVKKKKVHLVSDAPVFNDEMENIAKKKEYDFKKQEKLRVSKMKKYRAKKS